jgi:hypothetical protein
MMRKRSRRRPEFEAMEKLVLLSGASIVGQYGVAALFAREPRVSGPIVLAGRAEGKYKMNRGETEIHFEVNRADIRPLGKLTSIKGSVELNPQGGYSGEARFSVAGGGISTSLSSSGPDTLLYTITSGHGKFKGATGSGVVAFSFQPSRGNPHAGKYTFTFGLTTS